jgi:hypothetical protein
MSLSDRIRAHSTLEERAWPRNAGRRRTPPPSHASRRAESHRRRGQRSDRRNAVQSGWRSAAPVAQPRAARLVVAQRRLDVRRARPRGVPLHRDAHQRQRLLHSTTTWNRRFRSTTCSCLRRRLRSQGKGRRAKGRGQRTEGRGQRAEGRGQSEPFALCPLPFALCPLPFALRPSPFALRPSPFALRPSPSALRPPPSALCPAPSALCPSPPLPYRRSIGDPSSSNFVPRSRRTTSP